MGKKAKWFAAAKNGDLPALKELQAQGVNVKETDIDGRNALHLAVIRGNIGVSEYLLSVGIDIDSKGGEDERTALNYAAAQGHKNVVHLLHVLY